MTQSFDGRTAEDLEAFEDALLAPYAVRSAGAVRRYAVGDQGRTLAYRTAFQRDRDRILHSLAFRRLKHKTQVYVPYEGDHHRTRLTHTLEVAQVARTMARALGLNEDLAEAVALGHDLGQPPFGAGGEEVLADLLSGDDPVEGVDPDVLASSGGFRPSYQSLRVVDRLEQRYQHPGLNLTDPVREGIWKTGPRSDRVRYPDWEGEGLAASEPPHLEAQVVAVADRIARLAHDLEDGIRAGEVSLEAAERIEVGRAVVAKLGDSYPLPGQRYKRQNTLMRGMIHLLVSDVVVQTARRLQPWLEDTGEAGEPRAAAEAATAETRETAATEEGAGIEEEDAVGAEEPAEAGETGDPPEARHTIPRMPADTVDVSDRLRPMVDELEGFVESQVYRSFAVSRLDSRARTFIKGLFLAYYREPLQLDDYALYRYRAEAGGPYLRDVPGNKVEREVRERYRGNPAFVRLVADHIAGMSDTYALKEYERLYLPFPETEKR